MLYRLFYLIRLIRHYIQRIPFMKEVKNGGNITQNHSGLKIRKMATPTKDNNVYIQYILTESEEVVISFYNFVF